MRKIPRKYWFLTGLSAFVFGFYFQSRFFSAVMERRTSDEVLFHVDTSEKVIALTIDDGPHAEITPQILDVLAEYDVRATFFVIGSRIAGNETIMERMVAEGHELGNHLMTDDPSIGLESAEFVRQLEETHGLISEFGEVGWFRPGSGWYNDEMLSAVSPLNYKTVIGSVYPYDAQFHTPRFASRYILSNTQAGSIIILHEGQDDRDSIVDVLRRTVPELQSRGYRFVLLDELIDSKDK